MKYCPNCGHKLEANYKVCPNCGFRLRSTTDSQTTTSTEAQKTTSTPLRRSRQRSSREHTAIVHGPAIDYLIWLKNNWITMMLALLLVFLTYIYVGKIISLIVAIGLVIWGFKIATNQRTPLDHKIKRVFAHAETQTTAQVQRMQTKRIKKTAPLNQIAPPQNTVVANQPIQVQTKRSWGLLLLALITASTSYWPAFFLNNLLGGNNLANATAPSLAETIKQGLLMLNYNFHLQINPDLGLWLLAAGPVVVILGSLMPNHFGRSLATKGAGFTVILYVGAWIALKLGAMWGVNFGWVINTQLGMTGYVTFICIIIMFIWAEWQRHHRVH